ncbi:MerR family transcriptional regulator [Actinoplanes sp. G11-F43]|uniref:MerR family transcriptional regulator n=1 Tax=Actinoplanes sp. G11-F43 TaxID=3424130 RepID=UPI003D34246F
MRIGDAAAAAGATPRALRFYEDNGLLPPARRTSTGQRVYGARDVARIRTIRELLASGFTVGDLRACAGRLDLADVPGRCSTSEGIAGRRVAALNAEIERLTVLRDRLAARITTPV